MASGFLRKHLRQFVSAANRYACAGTILGLLSVTFFSANLYAYPQVVLDKAKVGSKDINSRELFDLSKSRSSLEASGKASLRSVREKEEIEGFLAVARKSEAQRVKEQVIEKRVVKAYSLAVQASKEFLEAAPNIEIAQLFSVGDLDNPDRIRAHRGALTEIFKSDALPKLVVGGEFEGSISTLAGFVESVDGHPTIFLNPYWAHYLNEEELVPILLEELGHYVDSKLNPGRDAEGDEGLRFSEALFNVDSQNFSRELSRHEGVIRYAGKDFSAEFASFTFSMSFKVQSEAAKETNIHTFKYSDDLGIAQISDGKSERSFTGNDLAVSLYFFGSQSNTFGYLSRPIKVQGEVRGIWMWRDTDSHTSISNTLDSGTGDADGSTADNEGFVLVIDKTYFQGLEFDTSGSGKNEVTLDTKTVGSSSDGVTSAINAIIIELSPVSITSDSKSEGTSLIHTVTYADSSGDPSTTPYETTLSFTQTDITATGGDDYNTTATFSNNVSRISNYLVVQAGLSSFTITYASTDDGIAENNEQYQLNLETLTATGTIVDNDSGNTSPVAANDSNSVTHNATLTVNKSDSNDALDNDSDSDNDTITITAIRTGTEQATDGTSGTVGQSLAGVYGALTLNADGSYSYVAAAQTPTNSDLFDVFTYTASDGNGGTDTAELKIQVLISSQTLAKVVTSKTGTAGAYAVGDVVTYTITQTNTGNVTLNNVVITDDKIIKSTTSGETGSCTSVAPSATCILVGTYTITQTEKDAGTFTNTASVKSDEIPTALEDSNTITLAQSAAQTLAKVVTSKTGTAGAYAVGDVVTYTITQTNTGNVTLNNVVITDDKVTKSTTSGETGSCTSVAPSATCILVGTYTITQTEKDAGTFKNTASVKSTEIPTALEASNTITLAANAKPTLSKALTSNADEDKTSTITVGDTLTYTVTLLNDGDVTITDTTITDDKISPSSASCSSVAVNGTCVLTGTYKVTQADVDAGKVTNNAASTSKNPAGDDLDPAGF